MALHVCSTAVLQCSFGTAPSSMQVLPDNEVITSNFPAATIMDNIPMVNIMPFAMCTSIANPQVATATAAAMGVLTPMPCIPVIPAPWTPGAPTVQIANIPSLDDTCTLMCAWAGVISVTAPGQSTELIP